MSTSCRILARSILNRSIYATAAGKIKPNFLQVEEVRIPVPWGHVAGKWWGDKNVQPVIALHGVQDNAATFDKLFPLLEIPSILALDLPGHGHSSHLPYGITIHYLDNITFMRDILRNYFNWKNLHLLGHSFGSSVWFAYASMFPDEVEKYVSIDCGRFNLIPDLDNTVTELRRLMDWQLECEAKMKKLPPEYTMEKLVEVMYKGRKAPMALNKEACKTLLSRGTSLSESGCFYLSRDMRLKYRAFGRMSLSFILALSKKIKCEVLYIRATKGIIEPGPKLEGYHQSLERTKRSAKRFESYEVEGYHHLHLENPESLSKIINNFLVS